ncbi:MAG: dihydropteroate synthase [Thermodesulfobacteriota bacterium]
MDIEKKKAPILDPNIKVDRSALLSSSDSDMKKSIFKCKDHELEIGGKTYVMGVLNLTPDSFYDGGRYTDLDKAIFHVEQMIEQGADIIDVGGESTRPGSSGVTLEEELDRTIPAIKQIKNNFDTIISIDTTKSKVAKEALLQGASIVNDISGLNFDPLIGDVAAEYKAGVILTHTSSKPIDMQEHTSYESVIEDVIRSLEHSIHAAKDCGVDDDRIAIDPGFGFGKTAEQNLTILKNLHEFSKLEKPILIGTSNKTFIGKTLDADIDSRTEGTAATIAVGILNGASIIRVHDIAYMSKVSKMVDAIKNAN